MNWTKKTKIFFIITIFIVILFIGFNYLSSIVIKNRFSNAPSAEFVKFYEKYINELNHLRDPRGEHIKIITDLMYTTLGNGKNEILIQGDSWGEQFLQKDSLKNLKKFNNDTFTFILAGISSYSPSLFTVQLRKLKEDFNFNPEYIFTIIDQTDIGDEICRYQNYRRYKNGNLIVLPYENFTNQTYETYKPLERWKIVSSNSLSSVKVFKLAFFKIEELFNNNKNIGCSWTDISYPLVNGIDKFQEELFTNNLNEYIEKVFENKKTKGLYILTHPHKSHFTSGYKLNVYDLVKKIIKNNSHKNNIKLLDVYEFAKLSNKSLNETNIFKENDIASHVKDSYHAEIFTKYIYEILNENY